MLKLFLCNLLFGLCLCKSTGRDNARNIFVGAYTSTVQVNATVTSIIPSSCVYVASTLPPCRSVRNLQFPTWVADMFSNSVSENSTLNATAKEVQPELTSLGWGEYLGLFAPTVTVTNTNTFTVTKANPSVVVTFAIRGCKPSKLPKMPVCEPDAREMAFEEVLPTSTVQNVASTEIPTPTPTLSNLQQRTSKVESFSFGAVDQQQSLINNNLLEGSTPEIKNNSHNLVATKTL